MSGMGDAVRKVPGMAAAEGAITGALANEEDLPIKDYDKQTAEEITAKLPGFSQRELRLIEAYERKHENRTTITDRISKLAGEEPWSGYDEMGVGAIEKELTEGDVEDAKRVRSYERAHKERSGVIDAAERRINSK